MSFGCVAWHIIHAISLLRCFGLGCRLPNAEMTNGESTLPEEISEALHSDVNHVIPQGELHSIIELKESR